MKLYNHQAKIIADDPEQTGLWLGTGSGKTRIALSLAEGSTLVIAPKTQVEDQNWEREWNTILDLGHDAGPRAGLTVISKEAFRRDHETLEAFDTVIGDEAHTLLGVTPNTRYRKKIEIPKTSQLFEALESYLARTKPARLYLCTATLMKSPMTVWGALKLLGKIDGTLQGFLQFRHTFYTKLPMPGREVWVPKKDSESKNKLAYYVRSMGYVGRLSDYFDVPEQTFVTKNVELTQKQKDRIKELRLEYPEPIVRIGKRHQVENGLLTADEFNRGELFDNGKLDAIKEYALQFPQMIIVAKYRAQIDQLAAELAHEGYKVLTMTGDTKERGVVIADAKAAKECIFIVQAQISAGWELPEYPVMIFASRTYSFVDYDQALGRIQRANNIKKNLYINLVVKGGVDEAVDKSLANKSDFNERLYAGI